MTWLIWRQIRTQFLAVHALVAAGAVVLAVSGPRLADLTPVDGSIFSQLTQLDRFTYYSGIVVLAVVPALIGIFWGAPLVARELENGTHRLAWNQSVTRTRWLAAKLGVATLATALAVGTLTLAVTWWTNPLDGIQSETRGSLPSRLAPVAFAMRGIVPISYAVFALVLGVTLGILLRRSLPAMALTLAIYVVVQIAVPFVVRANLIPTQTQTVAISMDTMAGLGSQGGSDVVEFQAQAKDPGDWVIANDTVDSTGKVTGLPAWFAKCMPQPPRQPPSGSGDVPSQAPAASLDACFDRLATEGYQQRVVVQPVSHFWPLQWAETGLYAAVSALLAGLAFWWTKRKLS
ncbi:putative transmembrane transport protein [Janibacter sp. HTCC2649]|uniref:ABC transporter permease subunit n=1 Tax=Janibacter sp. HTCC2649 TaxID=313589 RepID=UPI00006718AE|nr:ABC transporter permease subunit [Janibacter sp. HTCC2649]EAP97899.1 putative transmembrane transport protein [Janibacter sp. HTCC2649]